jgi:hypothetical protein
MRRFLHVDVMRQCFAFGIFEFSPVGFVLPFCRLALFCQNGPRPLALFCQNGREAPVM